LDGIYFEKHQESESWKKYFKHNNQRKAEHLEIHVLELSDEI
jgi:hypothetical protein